MGVPCLDEGSTPSISTKTDSLAGKPARLLFIPNIISRLILHILETAVIVSLCIQARSSQR